MHLSKGTWDGRSHISHDFNQVKIIKIGVLRWEKLFGMLVFKAWENNKGYDTLWAWMIIDEKIKKSIKRCLNETEN